MAEIQPLLLCIVVLGVLGAIFLLRQYSSIEVQSLFLTVRAQDKRPKRRKRKPRG
jgi:hypothetical protein